MDCCHADPFRSSRLGRLLGTRIRGSYQAGKVTGNTQYAPYTIDWTEAADSCSTAFIERFYCSENRNGYEGVFSYREYNATGSANSNNYWQQAHAMAAW